MGDHSSFLSPTEYGDIVGDIFFHPKFALKVAHHYEKRRLRKISAYNVSTIRASKKCSIITHGTVVPTCCKDDYQSRWENLKFDPPTTQKWSNRSPPNFARVTTSGSPTILRNFIMMRSGVFDHRIREIVFTRLLFFVLCSFVGTSDKLAPRPLQFPAKSQKSLHFNFVQ